MGVPICPVHNVPMRESSKGGGYFCARKDAAGNWCKEKGVAPATAGLPAGALAVQRAPDALPAAALVFAGHLCHGAGPEMADAAVSVAIKALQAMRAVS